MKKVLNKLQNYVVLIRPRIVRSLQNRIDKKIKNIKNLIYRPLETLSLQDTGPFMFACDTACDEVKNLYNKSHITHKQIVMRFLVVFGICIVCRVTSVYVTETYSLMFRLLSYVGLFSSGFITVRSILYKQALSIYDIKLSWLRLLKKQHRDAITYREELLSAFVQHGDSMIDAIEHLSVLYPKLSESLCNDAAQYLARYYEEQKKQLLRIPQQKLGECVIMNGCNLRFDHEVQFFFGKISPLLS